MAAMYQLPPQLLQFQLLQFARQGISSPTQQAGRILTAPAGLLQGNIYQHLFKAWQRLVQQALAATGQLLLRPLSQQALPVSARRSTCAALFM